MKKKSTMNILKTYTEFKLVLEKTEEEARLHSEKKTKEKQLSTIKKFFNIEYIINDILKICPKIAIWMLTQIKDEYIKHTKIDKKDILSALKEGDNTKNKSFKNIIQDIKTFYSNINSKISNIVDWTKSKGFKEEDNQKIKNKELTFEQALEKAHKWHDSLVAGGVISNEKGTVLMTFDDDFYWIDLETTDCKSEADAMGHCGRTNYGNTIYSLRDKEKRPHITVAIDTDEGIIYQMKGRKNSKPKKLYHPYIVDLLINDKLNINGFSTEYEPKDDFSIKDLNDELEELLLSKKPNITKRIKNAEQIKDEFKTNFKSFYDSGYGEDKLTSLYMVDEIGGMDAVKKMYDDYSNSEKNDLIDELFSMFPEKRPEILNKKNISKHCSSYINANDIAKKYNIDIDPKESNSNKWDVIVNKLSKQKLAQIMKDEDVYDMYLNLKQQERYDGFYDIDSVLEFFFGNDYTLGDITIAFNGSIDDTDDYMSDYTHQQKIEFEKDVEYQPVSFRNYKSRDDDKISVFTSVIDLSDCVNYIIRNWSVDQKREWLEEYYYSDYDGDEY